MAFLTKDAKGAVVLLDCLFHNKRRATSQKEHALQGQMEKPGTS
jgi:hypothetical protein